MKTLTLEPCPMCGDDPYILYHPEEDPNKIQVKIQCECGLTMTHWIGIIEDRWNRRKYQGNCAHCVDGQKMSLGDQCDCPCHKLVV